MILNIAAAVLILAITFMHSLFGLFSGLINATCAITAMCVAYGFVEPVNALAVEQGLPANYSLAVTFLLLFFVTHLVLRVAADNLIRGNVYLPRAVDLAGGAVCGALIAMISVGVLVTAFLMLPFGGRVAMFSRYERTDVPGDSGVIKFDRNSVWFKPDEFTAGLFSMLSRGSLKYRTSFADVYPSFANWVTWTGNTVQPESATSPPHSSKSDGYGTHGLGIEGWWVQKGPLAACYRSKLPTKEMREHDNPLKSLEYKPQPGKELIGVRLKLLTPAADRDQGSRYHRFRPSMLRLVGEERHSPRQYMPRALGGVVPGDDRIRVVDVDNNFALPTEANETLVDAYFEVGEGFEPHFAEYRRFARAPLLPKEKLAAAPDDRLIGPEPPGSGRNRIVGPASFMRAVVESGTGSRSALPYPLSATMLATMRNVVLKNGKLESGRISGFVRELTGSGNDVREFALPEGKGMFQLRFKAKEAASLAGKVFNFVASVTNQYMAVSRSGERYYLAGFYAVVQRREGEYLELYVANAEEAAASRSMLKFEQVTRNELRNNDTEIGLLFFVRPGEVIIAVENQGGQGAEFKPPGYRVNP
jgi:hypothetical protein